MDDQVVKMGEGLLEVQVLCHDSALAIGDFDVAPSDLLKVGQDLEILRKLSRGSDELHKKHQ
jgi:hypothetical protein